MRRGSRDADALRRRLAILAHLQRGPQPKAAILGALIEAGLIDSAETTDADGARRINQRWEKDMAALRAAGCEVRCDKRTQRYQWHNPAFGLNLTESQLFALGILRHTFADTTMLHHAEIHALLDDLVNRLPAEQRAAVERGRPPYQVDLRETTDYRQADPPTVKAVERAIERGEQLELQYQANDQPDPQPYLVEPRPLTFRDGHVYLPVYHLAWGKEINLRLDGIIPGTARSTGRLAQRSRPPGPTYHLCYRLSPSIVRHRKASEHFPGQQEERYPDGSATITATVTDLFVARRRLLSYGDGCTILSPPELIAEIRTIVAALYQRYSITGE